ncbi:hypothetical protein RHMOL_Rhmol01G0218700 [Rhododendron molle]|uniref:Uncharacterized protein n=1 Tax=Rhododendron molle TaxID=49168 RepID=A0ACC0Q4D5_RHOML|nr:hypothetical protein RHMOL_Rhmol01G0218700 [Rhododendron molle]
MEEFDYFLQATKKDQVSTCAENCGNAKLRRPPVHGRIKINVDGAFEPSSRNGGVGVVFRNASGDILGAMAVPILGRASAEMVEAEGFRIALASPICSSECSYSVEGDAQTVINMLQGKRQITACLEVIISDILSFGSRFNSCSFVFVPRNCNRVANVLAKYVLFQESTITWLRDFPSWVNREASLDVSLMQQ